jgi:uncharacterized membrane protein YdjX (TVP38/TMEM64 family)
VSVANSRGKSRVRWQAIPLTVLVVVLVSYVALEVSGVVSFTDTLDRLRESGRLAVAVTIFTLLVVDSVLPVPSSPLIALAGSVFGTPVGAVLTIAGSMGCSAASYAVGRFASPLVRRRIVDDDELREMQEWGDRFGRWMFVFSRGLPLMTETVGTSAGIARAPVGRFLGYTLLGTVPVCLIYVVAGSYAETAQDILAIATLGFVVPVALWYAVRRVLRRKQRTPAPAEPDQL